MSMSFLPVASKIEQCAESWSWWCDEHQDEHKNLYWLDTPEHNTLHSVWVSVCFIDLGELDQRTRNGGDYKLGECCEKKLFFWSWECFCKWESVLVRPRPHLNYRQMRGGLAIYPSVHHDYGALTCMAGPPLCRVCSGPYAGPGCQWFFTTS
jgi:hypothetical protein